MVVICIENANKIGFIKKNFSKSNYVTYSLREAEVWRDKDAIALDDDLQVLIKKKNHKIIVLGNGIVHYVVNRVINKPTVIQR